VKRHILWTLLIGIPLSYLGCVIYTSWIHGGFPIVLLFVPAVILDAREIVMFGSVSFWLMFAALQFFYFFVVVGLIRFAIARTRARGRDR
jgi:uncharacterized membrane protein